MQGANHDGLQAFDRFGQCSERGDVGFRIQQDNPTSLYEEFAYLSARAVHGNESALVLKVEPWSGIHWLDLAPKASVTVKLA